MVSLTDRELSETLRWGGHVLDEDFDAIYPPEWRTVSASFWTPIRVARCAARLLVTNKTSRVLDVGAGVGKLCVVGSLATGVTFTGIEHRAPFVEIATETARRLGARVRMVHGTVEDVRWEDFDAFYFYNPFSENVMPTADVLDASVELSSERLQRDILAVEAALARAPIGTRVVTYHGFGGRIPTGYQLLLCEPIGLHGALRLWRKVEESTGVGDYEVTELELLSRQTG